MFGTLNIFLLKMLSVEIYPTLVSDHFPASFTPVFSSQVGNHVVIRIWLLHDKAHMHMPRYFRYDSTFRHLDMVNLSKVQTLHRFCQSTMIDRNTGIHQSNSNMFHRSYKDYYHIHLYLFRKTLLHNRNHNHKYNHHGGLRIFHSDMVKLDNGLLHSDS